MCVRVCVCLCARVFVCECESECVCVCVCVCVNSTQRNIRTFTMSLESQQRLARRTTCIPCCTQVQQEKGTDYNSKKQKKKMESGEWRKQADLERTMKEARLRRTRRSLAIFRLCSRNAGDLSSRTDLDMFHTF
jgi:hypothetical protein